ncbi:MAG TPA: 2Fe-2S iron-sulfur cluster binding domain-containing protein, partial [Chloroflexi bacterium]|nr:2Fe-2S iron-sulfur cluster binding domain-containing protein [Chloroflexota bacterium]
MPDVRVTIDGKEVSVPAQSTVLEAAEAAGVEIPVLCHHPVLKPIGACRMCLVEVEKQRTLQPACTFPVTDGMVVHTASPAVMDARRFVLQLLFSERNHFCMFCQQSGSCELQSLAYQYGLDHWEYDRAFPEMPVDASRKYFAMDHNRCILCRRCIRVCDEMVGNHTLGLKNRGAETMVIADMDVPFGESSCVSCGSCLQVCPTGALMDRASAYLGADEEVTRVKSRCMACSVGCGVELVLREGRVIRIEGDWDAEPNHGLLCEIGRFMPLHETRQRARKPMVRD